MQSNKLFLMCNIFRSVTDTIQRCEAVKFLINRVMQLIEISVKYKSF